MKRSVSRTLGALTCLALSSFAATHASAVEQATTQQLTVPQPTLQQPVVQQSAVPQSTVQPLRVPAAAPRPSAAGQMAMQQPLEAQPFDDSALPTVQHSGSIAYITGGIGEEERQALEAVRRNYNLHVMSANVSGAFAGDAKITIRDTKGNALVNAEAGPLFYAELPKGSYVLEANNGAQTLKQNFRIDGGKPAHVHLGWK